jgi:3-oxoadipate enol-lactonase
VPTAQANGISIYYEIRGEGDPLVIIQGLSVDLTSLKFVVSELSKSNKVITFDNRGAGRTDKPDIPYTIEMMADDTRGMLDVLGVQNANFVGISLGGRIAMSFALKYPQMVKRLILVSTAPKVPDTCNRRLYFALAEIPRRLAAVWKKYPQPQYAYMRQRRASEGFDATEELQRIRAPTLVIHGKKDRLVPYALALDMQARIPSSQMRTFDGGHLFFFLRPKEFAQAVNEFLKSEPQAPSTESLHGDESPLPSTASLPEPPFDRHK